MTVSDMMQTLTNGAEVAGLGLGWSLCILLCLVGLTLSCFSISGTWLAAVAAFLAHVLVEDGAFPGLVTLLLMLAVCAAVDIIEWFAASWGVKKRGGSRAASWMAFLGSIVGAILGGMLIPLPFIGSLIGMFLGSFALVYLIERRRLRQTSSAAHIATGAVLAGMAVLMMKIGVTAALILWLTVGLIL